MSSLEERIAALEERVAHPLLSISGPDFSEEEQTRFREAVDAAMTGSGWKYEVLPPAPPLTPDQIRSLLRECVTVVKPGETLIFSPAHDLTPHHIRELGDYANRVLAEFGVDCRIVVLPPGSLGVAEAASDG